MSFLLQHHRKNGNSANDCAYVSFRSDFHAGSTPLFAACGFSRASFSPRIVRLLVDAGADTTSPVRTYGNQGALVKNETPLFLTTQCLRTKMIGGREASEEQLCGLGGIRRLLLQTEAVHALSWLWPGDAPLIVRPAEGANQATAVSATQIPLKLVPPMMRRRVRRRGAVLAPLLR